MGLLDRIQKIETPESKIVVDGIRYIVRGLSGLDSSVISAESERENKRRKQIGLGRLSLDYFYLSKCVTEHDSGETLTPEQWASVLRKHTAPLVVEVMRHNGLDDEDVERDPNDFSTTET